MIATKKEVKGYIYEKDYAWDKKYGDTKEQAFETIKALIVQVIKASKDGDLKAIEKIDLDSMFKWKIAFHYQNINDMKIISIFNRGLLQKIADKERLGLGKNPKISEIHEALLSDKTYTLEMMGKKSLYLLNKYDKNSKNSNEKDTMPNLNTTKEIPLNQILYGPPGTGKTYSTINKALEILGFGDENSSDGLDYEKIRKKLGEIYEKFGEITQNNEPKSPKNADLKRLDMAKIADKSDRQCAKSLFDYYKMQKQIAFITFHQNFSYEEFIEGIKPEIENSGKSDVIYTIKDGIFKEICADALENLENSQKSQRQLNEEFSIKELFEAFAEDAQRRLDEGETINFSTPSLNTKKNITKINYFKNGETKSIAISADLQPVQVLTRDIVLRDYENFKKGVIKSRKDVKPSLDSQSAWHGNGDYYFALYERLRDFEKTKFKPERNVVQSVDLKPFILIIDEINRGNIAKILGELITLLEPSKRIGSEEEIRVSLPYSENKFDGGRGFGVPKNLYLIGTMNTADRSIALLDTALRRRFEFVEMMPDYENKGISTDCNGVNLRALLRAVNNRIEFLLDREHTLGHSFFIDITSLEALKNAFKTKIIPLLQEYFYEDYAKIDAVLNENGMVESHSMEDFSVNLSDDFVDSDKKIWRITKPETWDTETFIAIYKA